MLRALARTGAVMVGIPLAIVAIMAAVHFPYATDEPSSDVPTAVADDAQDFYEEIYSPAAASDADGSNDHRYVQMGQSSNENKGILEAVSDFVAEYRLSDAKVLEVGAGSGQLQDIVSDYTGLDIAANARRYFHKPFVAGSATELPFADDEFDAMWTVWTLEHVPNPELALQEARRVVKPGGYLFLAPAWFCNSWAAEGYEVRPYSDFGFSGKVAKAGLALRTNGFYQSAGLISGRIARRLLFPPDQVTRLRYRKLDANFDDYWVADSDAVNSLDPHEVMLWYTSRGDECLNCPDTAGEQLMMGPLSLVIRVNKVADPRRAVVP